MVLAGRWTCRSSTLALFFLCLSLLPRMASMLLSTQIRLALHSFTSFPTATATTSSSSSSSWCRRCWWSLLTPDEEDEDMDTVLPRLLMLHVLVLLSWAPAAGELLRNIIMFPEDHRAIRTGAVDQPTGRCVYNVFPAFSFLNGTRAVAISMYRAASRHIE